MPAVSYKVSEPVGSSWHTLPSAPALCRQFRAIDFSGGHQTLSNRLKRGGAYHGAFTHIESDKVMTLDIRYAEGTENCVSDRHRTGPASKTKQSAARIVRSDTPSSEDTAEPVGLQRFAVVEKDALNPKIDKKFQDQSSFACAGYAHSLWAVQG